MVRTANLIVLVATSIGNALRDLMEIAPVSRTMLEMNVFNVTWIISGNCVSILVSIVMFMAPVFQGFMVTAPAMTGGPVRCAMNAKRVIMAATVPIVHLV